MRSFLKTSMAMAAIAVLIGCNKTEPDSISGEFFTFTVDVIYKGEPVRIEYPAACKLIISKNIDGDRSVDGASLVPSVFGVKTIDGGALVVKTPNFCDSLREIDDGTVSTGYNPLIVHYQDANSPTFGLGYYGLEAFEHASSPLKFTKTEIKRIGADDFINWRSKNPNANWVTYERMNADRNPFKRKEWKKGERYLSTVCRGAAFHPIPEELKQVVTPKWNELGNPLYWSDPNTDRSLLHSKITIGKKTIFLKDDPRWLRQERVTNIKPVVYPSDTAFSMNLTNEFGRLEYKGSMEPPLSKKDNTSVEQMLPRGNIRYEDTMKGFLYCNSHDGNHIKTEDMDEAFEGYQGYYYLNNRPLYTTYQTAKSTRYPLTVDQFMETSYYIRNKNIFFLTMGDAL